ncbi:YKT6 protein, partial [Semnornis frantzii]|nr:YKT6 protein [Semnornis frantzii]
MRLYSLSVLYKGDPKVLLLKAAFDVSCFSFFQRASVQEFLTFTSQLIVERSQLGTRASVKEQGERGQCPEVPTAAPASSCLCPGVLDDFSRQVPRSEWPSGSPGTISYTALDGYLSKYQVGHPPR